MYNNLTKGNLFTIIISLIATAVCFFITVFLIPIATDNEQIKLFSTTIVSTIGAAFLVNFYGKYLRKRDLLNQYLRSQKSQKTLSKAVLTILILTFQALTGERNWQRHIISQQFLHMHRLGEIPIELQYKNTQERKETNL